MIYIVQLFVVLVARYLGRHDGPACDQFSEYGTNDSQQKLFHGTNWKAKAVISMIALVPFISMKWPVLLMLMICYTFIMWSVFNVSLNLVRHIPERPWDYISTGSNLTDRTLRHWFGEKAGRYLVFISLVLVIVLNILMRIFYAKSYPDSFGLVSL
jgi:hypothetical protein